MKALDQGWICVLLLLGIVLLDVSCGQADPSSMQARDVVKRGTVEAGAMAGYLQGHGIVHAISANRNALYVLPRLGPVLTDELESGLLAGNLELLVEPLYAHYFKPFGASAAGGSLVAKYNFLAFGRWMPFWDIGAGMLWTDLAPRIREQSTPFNFVLQTGPGLQYFATESLAWTLGVRYHHISNAWIGERNLGLDSVLIYTGLSFFLPR